MADLEQLTVGSVLDLIEERYRAAKRSDADEKNTTRWATQADIDAL